MPFPTTPIDPDAVDEGAPTPIVEDSLAAPEDADVTPEVDPEFEQLPEPVTAEEALPLETPVALADGDRSVTLLSYLRDATDEGVLVHVLATAAGLEPVRLDEIELGVEFPDGQTVSVGLPIRELEPTQTWEADLLLEAVVADLAPGASTVRYSWGDQPDQYAGL